LLKRNAEIVMFQVNEEYVTVTHVVKDALTKYGRFRISWKEAKVLLNKNYSKEEARKKYRQYLTKGFIKVAESDVFGE